MPVVTVIIASTTPTLSDTSPSSSQNQILQTLLENVVPWGGREAQAPERGAPFRAPPRLDVDSPSLRVPEPDAAGH